MPWSLLLQWAKLTGMFGVAIGMVGWTFNNIVIRRLRTPGQADSAKLLKLLIILTFSIGVLGLLVYAAITILVPKPERSSIEINSVKDTVDFRRWRPAVSVEDLIRTGETSIVIRHRIVTINKISNLDDDFLDRITTTGADISSNFMQKDASFEEITPKSGRTRHEYLLTLPKDVFNDRDSYVLDYTLTYNGGWVTTADNWVGKVIAYPTKNYSFVLIFPSPWRSARVNVQPPGATVNKEISNKLNSTNSLIFNWQSSKSETYKPGTRISVTFEWPPLTNSPTHI